MTTKAEFWNQVAEGYAAKPVENPDAFERKIAITKAQMRPGDVVLDIGCGTGSLALRLAPEAGEVHGLDVSDEMVRIAEEKTAAQGVDNVTFHTGLFDEGFTAFEPGSLDGICAYSILHLLEDRTAALARIHALLKPGGFFVSSTVSLGETWIPFRPILAVMRWIGKAPVVKIVSRQTLLDELAAAGFEAIEQPDVGAKKIVTFLVARRPAGA
jgi:arsenite methyltransferase